MILCNHHTTAMRLTNTMCRSEEIRVAKAAVLLLSAEVDTSPTKIQPTIRISDQNELSLMTSDDQSRWRNIPIGANESA